MRDANRTIQIGAAIALAAALWPQTARTEQEPSKPDICAKTSVMTLTGKIRSVQSMREEPQAELQTFFFLDLPLPLCGANTVSVSVMGPIPCAEGETVTITGEFSPPEKMFNTAMLTGRDNMRCLARADAPNP